MAEEFEESEVVFPDKHDYRSILSLREEMASHESSLTKRGKERKQKKPRSLKTSSSVPVNIPSRMFQFRDEDNDQFEEEEDEDGELVPPHVIVGRRIEGNGMAFSVCSGNGRTLKGRDLSEVRNSILRLTGFLET